MKNTKKNTNKKLKLKRIKIRKQNRRIQKGGTIEQDLRAGHAIFNSIISLLFILCRGREGGGGSEEGGREKGGSEGDQGRVIKGENEFFEGAREGLREGGGGGGER